MQKKALKSIELLLFIVFALALIIRIPFLTEKRDRWYQVKQKPYADARQNDAFALNWLKGKGYGDYIYGFKYHAYRVPFYSFFLAFVYSFFGHNYFIIKLIQCLIGAGSSLIIFSINRAIFNKWVGLISAFLWSIHLHYIIYTPALLAETLFVFLFSVSILLAIYGIKDCSYNKMIAAGILIAITSLTRVAGIILLPALIIWIFAAGKHHWKKGLICALLLCLSFLATMAPWFIRNYQLTKQPLLFSSIGTLQLWNAANPEYYSRNARKAWYEYHWRQPYATEGERNRRANNEVIHFIKADFKGYLKSCYRRAYIFFKLFPPGLAKWRRFSLDRYYLANIYIIFIFITAPLGFLLLLPQWRKVSLHTLIFLGYSFFYFLSRANARYRMPSEIILVSFAAVFVYLLFNLPRIKGWSQIFEDKPTSGIDNQKIKRFKLLVVKILGFILAAMVIIFICRVSFAYLYPKERSDKLRISQSYIDRIMSQRKKLLSQWKSQGRESISYEDLFSEQAKNFGHFPKYLSQIIIWQGEISYCLRDKRSNIISLTMRINPSPHHFGENVIFCYANKGRINKMRTQHIGDDDLILVFGRLQERGERNFSFPCIIFFRLEKLK